MGQVLSEASLHVVEGTSLVVPVIINGLAPEIEALGRRWQRKREFHVTAASKTVIEAAGNGRPGLWDVVTRAASNRALGPFTLRAEVRRVHNPPKADLETLIVMVDAPGLAALHADLSRALDASLTPPPAHVTIYSTDPAAGIGIDNERELAERAPDLSPTAQHEVLRASGLDRLL